MSILVNSNLGSKMLEGCSFKFSRLNEFTYLWKLIFPWKGVWCLSFIVLFKVESKLRKLLFINYDRLKLLLYFNWSSGNYIINCFVSSNSVSSLMDELLDIFASWWLDIMSIDEILFEELLLDLIISLDCSETNGTWCSFNFRRFGCIMSIWFGLFNVLIKFTCWFTYTDWWTFAWFGRWDYTFWLRITSFLIYFLRKRMKLSN